MRYCAADDPVSGRCAARYGAVDAAVGGRCAARYGAADAPVWGYWYAIKGSKIWTLYFLHLDLYFRYICSLPGVGRFEEGSVCWFSGFF